MEIKPFLVNVSDASVSDLNLRLGLTRWPDDLGGGTWVHGTPRKALREIVDYWREGFDWRAAERRLNTLPQFTATIDGRVIHYVHVKGADAASAPLILTHGWPGSFVEMYDIIPLLTDPAGNGLPGVRSFDVVVPSLPGFGFSEAPRSPGTNSRAVALLWHALMAGLGYTRYFAIPPLSYASFPKEIINPPREWVERVFNVSRWTLMTQGGHFAALEQPLALATDIHQAFSLLR
jgi:Epoxide hydrolase N terminus